MSVHAGNVRAAGESWRRQPFVWFLIAIPASAVLVGLLMLGLSIYTYDGLVVDDYYRRGKEINRVLARDRFAAQARLHAVVRLGEVDSRQLALELRGRNGVELTQETELRFMHATRGEDHVMMLSPGPEGHALALSPQLTAGRWIVQLSTGQWRLVGSLQIPGAMQFELRPVDSGNPDS